MNFGLNRLQNHHLEPRTRLDLIMEPPEPVEEAGSAAVGVVEVEREHMFDKVVTPSDVGKLNRLVIPKQHAERFFPLDSSTNDKGLLLNFEDRNGKSWRFRYSYWNSSQSYVMTKGWSRFVKEKRLDAGDIVSFQRGVGDIGRDRLYIDWRRRPELPIDHHHHHHFPTTLGIRPSIVLPAGATAWGSLVWRPLTAPAAGYHHYPATVAPRDHTHLSQQRNNNNNNGSNVMYDWNGGCCPYGYGSGVETFSRGSRRLGEELEMEMEMEMEVEGRSNNQVQQEYSSGGGGGGGGGCSSMVVVQELKTRTKSSEEDQDTPVKKSRLRLFGVNMEMECPISSSSEECDLLLSSSSSSNSNPKATTHFQFQLPSNPSHHHQS